MKQFQIVKKKGESPLCLFVSDSGYDETAIIGQMTATLSPVAQEVMTFKRAAVLETGKSGKFKIIKAE